MTYLEISLNFQQKQPWTDIAIAQLAELNFEGFDTTNNILKAYISKNQYEENKVQLVMKDLKQKTNLEYSIQSIKNENWNEVWESSFEPVVVENKLHILAPFHEIPPNADTIVRIEPKMSFGTGHHPTTYLMCKYILNNTLTNKRVLDMGSGTGVLSILCEKFSSSQIVAIEIEKGAFENLKENIRINNCRKIRAVCGSFDKIPSKTFNYIFANINKNVLTNNFRFFRLSTSSNDILVVSGFLHSDRQELISIADEYNFMLVSEDSMDEWLLLEFKKK